MNRLWVWISVVILGVVLIVSLFPMAYRLIDERANPPGPPPDSIPFDQRTPEHFRQMGERRAWINITRTLAVAAVFGLIAGVVLTRWLVAPLRQLEQGAKAIARHELDYRVPLRGSAEMRSVASSFNQMAAELERQESLRRKMLADVTHELRHPIHVIQGNLRAILDKVYPLSMKEIDKLLQQTSNLTALVDDLHELALAEAKELPLNKTTTDLATLVANTAAIFQPLGSSKGVVLACELPSEPIQVYVDPARIRQALHNLLGNAMQYTPEGGQVRVVLARTEARASIEVRDTGMGIPPEDLPRVFDRFYRADPSRNRNIPGTGLGLAIAQAIVQAHGGEIEAASAGVNRGSAFTIRLPLETDLKIVKEEQVRR